MFGFNRYMLKVGLAKWLGFAYGLVWFFTLPMAVPDSDPMQGWAMLGWAITMGGVVGMAVLAAPRFAPPFNRIPSWLIAAALGGWMGVLAVLFAYDMIAAFMQAYLPTSLCNPWFLVGETAILGCVMGWASRRAFGAVA